MHARLSGAPLPEDDEGEPQPEPAMIATPMRKIRNVNTYREGPSLQELHRHVQTNVHWSNAKPMALVDRHLCWEVVAPSCCSYVERFLW